VPDEDNIAEIERVEEIRKVVTECADLTAAKLPRRAESRRPEPAQVRAHYAITSLMQRWQHPIPARGVVGPPMHGDEQLASVRTPSLVSDLQVRCENRVGHGPVKLGLVLAWRVVDRDRAALQGSAVPRGRTSIRFVADAMPFVSFDADSPLGRVTSSHTAARIAGLRLRL
jgi:hypothetical protein